MRETEGGRRGKKKRKRKEEKKAQRDGERAYFVAFVYCPFARCPWPISGYHNDITKVRTEKKGIQLLLVSWYEPFLVFRWI